MISRRSVLTAGVLAPLGWAAAAETRYRAHSVTVVNPFAAGGQSEPIGRIVNTHFQSALGQPFVMENRVGAGSTIGGQYVVRSAPDGYTLLLGTTSTFTIAPYVYRPQPYDPTTNLAPIIALTEAPTVLVASEKSGFRSLEDLVRAAKTEPGRITVASAGIGSFPHVFAEVFSSLVGVQLGVLARSAHPEDRAARDPEEVREIIARVRRNGFAERSPDVQPKSANTFSVPIRHGRKVLATLGVSYFISAMPKTKAIASNVPPLLDLAKRIERSVADLTRVQ